MKTIKVTPYKVDAVIHSLDGKLDKITVLEKSVNESQTTYIVDYKGTICTAIFNPFNCRYYVDDVYGIIKKYFIGYDI